MFDSFVLSVGKFVLILGGIMLIARVFSYAVGIFMHSVDALDMIFEFVSHKLHREKRLSPETEEALEEYTSTKPVRPEVVCLCGPTKFSLWFHRVGHAETMAGRIVLDPIVYPQSGEGLSEADAAQLKELHRRRIDMSDYVLVVVPKVGVDSDTVEFIKYAERMRKPVRYTKGLDK